MNYIQENRGYMTASKLKYFIKYGPEAFKLKYIDELASDEPEKRYFIVGSAFDHLVSYGKDSFWENYRVDGYLRIDLINICKERGIEHDKNAKVDELRELLFAGRTRLTMGEGEQVVGMYSEIMRQPLCDMGSNYETQHEVIAEYKGIKLRGVLDRFDLNRGIIRDWKTTGEFQNFEYNLDTKLDYVTSMAFYYTLCYINYDKKCDVILDVIGKKAPYPYMGYKLSADSLIEKVTHKIKPALDYYIQCVETNTRESVYPIGFYTEDKNGQIITRKAGDPISRTSLMTCDHYNQLKGSIAESFIEPL